MDNNLDINKIIDREQLSEEFYFQSLLEHGYSKGLFTDSEIEHLQYDCLAFLAAKVERFNAGESSSIRIEKAQDIMLSNMFTVGLWLKAYPSPDKAVAAIKNETVATLYEKGRKRIDTLLAATNSIHLKITGQLLDTRNVFYRATIVDGIEGFRKLYRPDFGAHQIHITADYLICNTMPRLAGVEFIHAYLSALTHENQFCLNFPPDDIHHLLCGYEEHYHELLINIYEQVLTAAIGCVLTGTDVYALDVSEAGIANLKHLFAGMTTTEILPVVQNASLELERIFDLSHGLAQYMRGSLPLIAEKIGAATRTESLDHVFFTPKYLEDK